MSRRRQPWLMTAVVCGLALGAHSLGALSHGALSLGVRSAEARGKETPPTSDRVIYAKGTALYSIASTGGESSVLVNLPTAASEVSRIRVAASGTAMLVSYSGIHAWADLSKRGALATLRPLPCAKGKGARISNSGDQVICPTQVGDRIAVYRMRGNRTAQIIAAAAEGPVFFLGESETPIGSYRGTLVDLQSKTPLSPHRPDRHMVTAPIGARAVGGFTEGEIDVVYTFKLDGKGVKRTLMQAARTVTISANAKWASLQQEVDACAVRISGGQYMCWRRYEALDISSGARSMLLSRAGETQGHDLFIGSVSGTSARKPTSLVQEVERAAAFWRDADQGASETEHPDTGEVIDEAPPDASETEDDDEGPEEGEAEAAEGEAS